MKSPGLSARGAAVVAVAMLLAACGSAGDDATSRSSGGSPEAPIVQVVASTNVYGDLVKTISGRAGQRVSITSFISDPAQDPHSYEANTQNQLKLSKADLVIENGGGYDDFMDRLLNASHNTSATVLNVVKISGKTTPAGGELNEHVWYDFPTVEKLVGRIAAALSAAAPADRDTFTANAATLTQKLRGLEAGESALRATHAGEGAAITEPVPLYLLEASGLVDKTPEAFSEAVEEGTDVPPTVLQQTLKLFTAKQVTVLVYNEQTTGPETEKVLAAAKAAGIAVVPVTETLPAGRDYLGWMSGNLSALRSALS